MPKTVTFVGTYTIPKDRLAEWSTAIVEMVDTVKANVPRIVSFRVYINEDSTEATSIYVHPDTESLEQHLEVAASRITAGTQIVETIRVELYGRPSQRVLEQLRHFSEMSNGFPVTVKRHFYGA